MHAVDVRSGQCLVDHADARHDAADRRLEAQLDLARARGLVDLLAVLRQHLLVGRYDVLAGLNGPQDVLARRLDAADELHDQVAALEDVVEVAARTCQDT